MRLFAILAPCSVREAASAPQNLQWLTSRPSSLNWSPFSNDRRCCIHSRQTPALWTSLKLHHRARYASNFHELAKIRAKSLVKPPNHLIPSHPATSAWHSSFGQFGKIEVSGSKKEGPADRRAFSFGPQALYFLLRAVSHLFSGANIPHSANLLS
jgi:hypothetical protein